MSDEPSLRESPERELRQLLKALPLRTRMKLRAKWFAHGVAARIPGYPTFVRLQYRVKRQGLSGLFEPPFNPHAQDRSRFDKSLRWHRWGVLREDGGYRAYTPTRRTVDPFESTYGAWDAIEDAYHGKPRCEWVGLATLLPAVRKDGSSPQNQGAA